MGKIDRYKSIIKAILEEYAAIPIPGKNIENQVIIDNERNHFQLVRVGWSGDKFIHYCVFHFDIKKDKIWLQENRTDVDIAEELVLKGVPKSDIVLGFQPDYARPFTGYAVE